jgi:hypothetical protein
VRLRDLAALYLVAGVACAVAIWRTSSRRGPGAAFSALLAVVLWPLWAPIALTGPTRVRTRHASPGRAVAGSPVAATAARIEDSLREGVAACAGTSFEAMLSRDAADRIAAEVRRAAERHAELGEMLARDGLDVGAAEARLEELQRVGASPRAVSTARLHLDNVRRLVTLRERDAQALDELSDLVQALRAQLVLARYAGPQADGAFGMVSDLWARVEGLGVALGADVAEEPGPAEVA